MEKGDLETPIAYADVRDEFGDLARALEEAREKLSHHEECLTEEIQGKTKELTKKAIELEENRQLLQQTIDNSTAVIYVKDTDGKYLLANHQFEELFNVKMEEVVGKTDYEIFPENLAKAFRKNDIEVASAGHTLEFEEVAPHKDGPHTYISLKFPIIQDGNKVTAVGGISTDITSRKHMEDAKMQFVTLSSHALNTPVSLIRWALEILIEDSDTFTETQQHLLADAHQAAESMNRKLKRMITISRIESHSIQTRISKTNVCSIVHEVEKDLKKEADAKQIQWSVECEDNLDVTSDRILLRESIEHIVRNAIQYTPTDGSIKLRARAMNKYVQIDVTDTGMGIAYDEQTHIFEKFFRGRKATQEFTEGTGNGLFVCRAFLSLINGIISCSSVEGEGSTFTIVIPRESQKEEPAQDAPNASATLS